MQFRISKNSGSIRSGVIGKLRASVFFAIFFGIGLVFLGFVGSSLLKATKPLFWRTIPATILGSEVRKKDGSHHVEIQYEYRWAGRAYTSDTYARTRETYHHYDSAYALIAELPPGTTTTCRVNPSAPAESVLRIGNFWFGLFALIPLIFVSVGAGGIWWTWRKPEARSASASRFGGQSVAGVWWIGGIFLLVGITLLFLVSIPMWQKAYASKNWIETPCTVLSSGVGSHSDDDGTTYSIDIAYRYAFGVREYQSDRYDLTGGSSSGQDTKAQVVARYPAGARAVCYVNPEKPYEAVLKPGISWGVWLGLLPLVFVAIGLLVICKFGLKPAGNAEVLASLNALAIAGPVELKSATSPSLRLLGVIMAALFWNGIVSVFLVEVVGGFQRGNPDWFHTLFLTPFVIVGIALIGAVFYFVLALGNPRVRLWMEPSVVHLGSTLAVSWELTGAVRRIRHFQVYLEGQEEARYRRGSSTSTERSVFARLPMADISSSWMDMIRGEGRLLIPADTVPSFQANSNQIAWSIKVRGEINRWPDLQEEYKITIVPPGGDL